MEPHKFTKMLGLDENAVVLTTPHLLCALCADFGPFVVKKKHQRMGPLPLPSNNNLPVAALKPSGGGSV
jgi:hypothetical protein